MIFTGLKSRILRRAAIRLNQVWLIRLIVRFRGLSVASDATMDIRGELTYGRGNSIGKASIIIIPETASLELGDGCYIGRYVELGPSGKVCIGDQTSIQDRCVILGDVAIGKYCLFSYNIYISSGRHRFELKPWWNIKDQDAFAAQDMGLSATHSRPVVIEDDCWIGINTVIMSGVTVGKGAVIGANSVVTKDIDPYTVVAGVPAKMIRIRLNFLPPKKIVYSAQQDLPYFYSGFSTTQSALQAAALHEGIQAANRFTIVLDTLDAKSVHLKLKGGQTNGAKLILNGAYNVDLPEKLDEVVFKVDQPINSKLCFDIYSEMVPVKVIVQEAWVE